MNVTEQDLRNRYEALETEQLISLQIQGTLTETATRVLDQVLAERGVSAGERATVASEIRSQTAAPESLASLGERLGAQVIDVAVMLVILVASIFLAARAPIAGAVGVGVAFTYLLLADGLSGGQSIGKRMFRIAVIDQRSRKPCTYGQSFVRNLSLAILGLIDWLFIFGRTRQRLGDVIAKTIVVLAKRREGEAAERQAITAVDEF